MPRVEGYALYDVINEEIVENKHGQTVWTLRRQAKVTRDNEFPEDQHIEVVRIVSTA